jgi:Fe2+ transport system protein FeoA
MNMESGFILLPRMPEGMHGRIVGVAAPEADRQRLAVLGLCVGRTIEVVQSGDPVIVRVLGTRIGLAAALARSIHVATS